jgi:SNF family Na+-dependent transporter
MITIVGCLCSLSLAEDSNLVIAEKTAFDIIEKGASNILLPLAAALTAILVG